MVGALIREGFAIAPVRSGRVLRLAFSGSADADAQPLLGDYFAELHTAVLSEAIDEVVVDVHELYFINSSCLKAFLHWVDTINGLAPPGRYRVRFLTCRELRWQVRTFDAILRMSGGSVLIETWPGGGL